MAGTYWRTLLVGGVLGPAVVAFAASLAFPLFSLVTGGLPPANALSRLFVFGVLGTVLVARSAFCSRLR